MNAPTPEQIRSADQTRWFTEEVQPHEAGLRAWISRRFPWIYDIDDLIQESYTRVLRAREVAGVNHAKSYLFATTRNAALDLARRHNIVPIDSVADLEDLDVLADRPDVREAISREQEIQLLSAAIRALPKRCRLVFKMAKLQGLSHREIAQKLGISENTVNAQLGAGLIRCRQYLQDRGVRQ